MENAIQKRTMTTFLERSVESIEEMEKAAELILQSKLAPDHFYEKGADGKPDYSKGNPAKVMLVAAKGAQLGVDTMNALQNIVPINGLLSIKGDLAKSLIFSSGVLEPGSWIEETSGNLKDGSFQVKITATRKDNKLTLSRTFSVAHAKMAGLWVSKEKLTGKEGWKFKHSPWVKFPQRMIYYRCLSYLARDLFSDVLSGMYVYEEAQDIPKEELTVIDAGDDKTLTIPDKEFAEDRSRQLTGKAVDTIEKNMAKHKDEEEAVPEKVREHPLTPDEAYKGIPKEEPVTTSKKPAYTEEGLKLFNTNQLLKIVGDNVEMLRAMTQIPGKNTNKKLRKIILAWQDKRLEDYVAEFAGVPESDEAPPIVPENPNVPAEKSVQAFVESAEGASGDKHGDTEDMQETGNKFGIEVTPLGKMGQRSFDGIKQLFEDMQNIAGVDNNMYRKLLEQDRFDRFRIHTDREQFCFHATPEEVNDFLNMLE